MSAVSRLYVGYVSALTLEKEIFALNSVLLNVNSNLSVSEKVNSVLCKPIVV